MFQTIRRMARTYLNFGICESNDLELNRRVQITNLFAFIGFMNTSIMGVVALVNHKPLLGSVLLVTSGLYYVAHYIQGLEWLKPRYRLSTGIVLLTMFALMFYLVIAGGHEGTGPMWIYIVPPVVFFFSGFNRGLVVLAAFLVSLIAILFYDDGALLLADYSDAFKSRVLFSFFTVTSLFAFYEYSRQQFYDQIQALSDEFERQARRDPLTKLPNRRDMMERLEKEQQRLLRQPGVAAILMLDVDHFKQVNDRCGHDAGDAILVALSELLRESIREQDSVARWGGEEFLFLLPNTSGEDAITLAEKLRQQIEQYPFQHQGQSLQITASIGIAELSDTHPLDKAVTQADRYLYQAKQAGRNCCLSEAH